MINLVSPMSNVAGGTITPLERPLPRPQITTLAAPNVKPNYAVLTWTAVGDDGVDGRGRAGYDLRYSTTPIVTDGDLRRGHGGDGPGGPARRRARPRPSPIHGLTPSTTYYFAIKARDEVPNWSPAR